ncbi:aromatic ring-hydroxylating dioxygenase subunit alpha [Hydrogenophaga sp. 5NK40-0174]|uniref:aromatic ring-hydroxylating dioxygenase subunit alpha n=1 Tax=Hydrogenophaga sp. 5NK40-0174 TaxID=3127649 RepID=UPI0031067707
MTKNPTTGAQPITFHPSGNAVGKPGTPYLTNCWYAAALSREVQGEDMLARQLLDTSVLLYRKADGEPVALHDRCPHRFVPLSKGKRDGDDVVCAYHALRFDCTGQCTHNPHGKQVIPAAAKVRSFPLLEKWGFIWIWMGNEPADASKLPDFGELDNGPASGIGHTYMPMKANFELIIDNVMDLSHVDHVHGEIISTRGQLTPQIPPVKEENKTVNVRWEWAQTPPMGIFAPFMQKPEESARHFVSVTWYAPATIQLTIGATQDDSAGLTLDQTVGQYDLHTCTPANANETHYWFATRRNHNVDDEGFNQFKIDAMHNAFVDEDGPIIEAVQREMNTSDFFSLNPVLITSDAAPVRVRRLLKQMIEKEAEKLASGG